MQQELIEIYILKTLNEIKALVKREINLDKDKETEVDSKMVEVLKDLITNLKFTNINEPDKLDISFLPIKDETEIKKIKTTLAIYYAALYYDNIELLQTLLKENVPMSESWWINLHYLNKVISSKFEINEYITMLKSVGYMFIEFGKSIDKLPKEQQDQYATQFHNLIKLKYPQIIEYFKSKKYLGYKPLQYLFEKHNLDTFNEETYKKATNEQLELISSSNNQSYTEETKNRLNYLLQEKGFKTYLVNYDLMLKLFSDEELENHTFDTSCAIRQFSTSQESLDKIIKFINLRPDLAQTVQHLDDEQFMNTDIYTLIESCDYLSNFFLHDMTTEQINTILKIKKPRSLIKRLFGAYKKED